MSSKHLLTLLLMIGGSLAAGVVDWNYIRGDSEKGPDTWSTNYEDCEGGNNSPINLDEAESDEQELPSWQLTGWDEAKQWEVKDKSYTVQFDLLNFGEVNTSGGMLGSEYTMLQFHFHWGAENRYGSEHTVNNESYPLEVHFVHLRSDFENASQALDSEESDALAAIGVFFEIGDEDNALFEPIVNGVTNKGSDIAIGDLSTIFSRAITGDFWRYEGGLTTPGCFEQVKWTVFKNPIKISQRQMDVFRTIQDNGFGTERYRPVQPLGSRMVTFYKGEGGKPSSATSSAVSLTVFGVTMLIFGFGRL